MKEFLFALHLIILPFTGFAEDIQKSYEEGIVFGRSITKPQPSNLDFLDVKQDNQKDVAKQIYDMVTELHSERPNMDDIGNGSIIDDFKKINDDKIQENFVNDQNIELKTIDSGEITNHICQEIPKPRKINCNENLILDVKYVDPVIEKQSSFVCNMYKIECRQKYPEVVQNTANHHGSDNPTCPEVCRDYTYFTKIKEQAKIVIENEKWEGNCPLNNLVSEDDSCNISEEKCLINETRYFHDFPITRCFQRYKEFSCLPKHKSSCGNYKNNPNCQLLSSECIEKGGKNCNLWEQSYSCRAKAEVKSDRIQEDKGKIFCLDGSCVAQDNEFNDDFNMAMAELSVFSDLGKSNNNNTTIALFTGSTNQCHHRPLGINNCCRAGNGGWGNNVIDKCTADEKALNEKKKQSLCVEVGSYCSSKILGKCLKQVRSYCCFNNEISRILHESGRKQIGMNFGTPKSPMCRGFSTEELQKIDLSKIDFSKIFSKIRDKVGHEKMNALKNKLDKKMKDKQGELHG